MLHTHSQIQLGFEDESRLLRIIIIDYGDYDTQLSHHLIKKNGELRVPKLESLKDDDDS